MSQWIVGIDYSMTCPAITIIDQNGPFEFNRCQFHYICDKVENNVLRNVKSARLPEYSSNQERFDMISDWAIHAIFSEIGREPVQFFMEGYAMSGKGRTFDIGENTGLFKHKLWKAGYSINLFTPTVIKKQASGKGNASKGEMYQAFVQRTGVLLMDYYMPKAKEVGSPVGDIVDSFYIALCGWQQVVGKV